MPVIRDQYVIVNIWTSNKNRALGGANCGHVSLTVNDGVNETYISLWPGHQNKPAKTGFFQTANKVLRTLGSDFVARPPNYIQDYEQDCILEASHERRIRGIPHIDECEDDETPYRFDTATHTYLRITSQPRAIRESERLVAIKLVPATFRMVLYSLDVFEILDEMRRLSEPDCVTGWTMVGSNLLTRNLNVNGKTTENCASLTYRCLNAGGLFNGLESKLSLQPSSAVAPDDLLRIIVAAKVHEQGLYTGDADDWKIADESPLDEVIEAYEAVGQNANPEHDIFPALKPSVSGCTIL